VRSNSILGKLVLLILLLDRDPARWNMDAKTVERRRGLFWEVFSSDMFHVRSPAIIVLIRRSDYPLRAWHLAVHHLSACLMSIVHCQRTMVTRISYVRWIG
jgi:hypothetical protein